MSDMFLYLVIVNFDFHAVFSLFIHIMFMMAAVGLTAPGLRVQGGKTVGEAKCLLEPRLNVLGEEDNGEELGE